MGAIFRRAMAEAEEAPPVAEDAPVEAAVEAEAPAEDAAVEGAPASDTPDQTETPAATTPRPRLKAQKRGRKKGTTREEAEMRRPGRPTVNPRESPRLTPSTPKARRVMPGMSTNRSRVPRVPTQLWHPTTTSPSGIP